MKRSIFLAAAIVALAPVMASAQVCGITEISDHNRVLLSFGTARIPAEVAPGGDVWLAETGASYSRALPSPLSGDSASLSVLTARGALGREDHRGQIDGADDKRYLRLGLGYGVERSFTTGPMKNVTLCLTGGLDMAFHAGGLLPVQHLGIPVSLALAYTLHPADGLAVSPFLQPAFAFYRSVDREAGLSGPVYDTDAGRDIQFTAGLSLRLSHMVVTGAYRMGDAALMGASQFLVSAGVAF